MKSLSTFVSVLSVVPPLAIGFLIVSLLWHKDRSVFSDLALKLCLSVGIGLGTSSCLVFIWMMIVGQLTRGVLVCELIALVWLSALLVWRKRSIPSAAIDQAESISIPDSKSPYLLRLAVWVASLLAAIRFWCLSVQDPHGWFDAYAIWNLRARFLYRGGEYWKSFTYMTWSHPDYPLLMPASIARSWEFIGRETQLIPITIGLLFTLATIGIVAISISRFRGERQGLLAGLVLLGTPFLIIHGTSQCADVPLSFFFVACVVLLFLYAQSPAQTHFLTLAGMAAGFSAWTKNEGILFVALSALLYWIVATATKRQHNWRRESAATLMGAVPVIAIVFVYKLRVAAANDLVVARKVGSTVPNLLDMSRYHLVIAEFAKGAFNFGQWSPALGLPLLLFFYFLLVGASVEKEDVPAVSMAVLLPACMIVGYFFVYILSPHDLAWHLESSLSRLLLQLWPLAIFAYFAIVRSPEQALMAESCKRDLPN